jgi:hypothetical protein
MPRTYGYDLMDGREVPQLVIASDHEMNGIHRGTVHVEGVEFTLTGELHGTLDVQGNSRIIVRGEQHGTVSIESGATVTVLGKLSGTVTVAEGARVFVEQGGRLAGTLCNHGEVTVRGVFGGKETGDVPVRLEGNGYIKQPTTRDGMSFYEW